MSSPRFAAALLVVVAAGGAACDTGDGRALAEPPPGATAPPLPADTTSTSGAAVNPPVGSSDTETMVLGSPAFEAGGVIPPEFTCIGENRSVPLAWSGVPADAVELAVTLVDLDAASGQFVHWAVTGLAPTRTGLGTDEDVTAEGAVEARNDSTEFGWYGPCPPAGERHRYVFTLYALPAPSGTVAGATGADVIATLGERATTTAVLDATFTSP